MKRTIAELLVRLGSKPLTDAERTKLDAAFVRACESVKRAVPEMAFVMSTDHLPRHTVDALRMACDLPPTPTRRPVDGHPGYLVDADGHVYSSKASHGDPRRLRARPHKRTGHLRVRLYGKHLPRKTNGRRWIDAYVHVLVCVAWHGPPPFEGALVRHGDRVPANNAPGNLSWGSVSDNALDREAHGTSNIPDIVHARYHRAGMKLDDGPGALCDLLWGF